MNAIRLDEAAELAMISRKTVDNRIKRAGVKTMRIGRYSYITMSDFEKICNIEYNSKYGKWILGVDIAKKHNLTPNKVAFIASGLGIKKGMYSGYRTGNRQRTCYHPDDVPKIEAYIADMSAQERRKNLADQQSRSVKSNIPKENRDNGYYARITPLWMMSAHQK